MKPRVLVTQRIPDAGLSVLYERCRVELFDEDRPMDHDELVLRVPGQAGLLSLLTDRIDAEVMDAAGPSLKVISNCAVGFNNIDLDAATSRGIVVTNTPGVLTETTADLVFALILACGRRIAEGDRFVRQGRFRSWRPMLMLGFDVHGKTLGIIGLGRIGLAVARRAKGFNIHVLYTDLSRADEKLEQELGLEFTDLDTLLARSDYVSINCPLTPQTAHLISERELNLMKPTAHLINTARGQVVDEAALVAALKEGRIAGAGLDVYENEPDLAPGLIDCDNAVLLPHIGSASTETRGLMAKTAAQNLLDVLQGRTPQHAVNYPVLKKL